MPVLPHTALFTDTNSLKAAFAGELLEGRIPPELGFLKGKKGAYFSESRMQAFLEEEARHDRSEINPGEGRALRTYSSGERKKALLAHLLKSQPEYLILDDPFDNLDRDSQHSLKTRLEALSHDLLMLQLVSRRDDLLSCIRNRGWLKGGRIAGFPDFQPDTPGEGTLRETEQIPPPPADPGQIPAVLARFRKVGVRYGSRGILKDIDWTIRQGEFWELRGPNGSGKSTLITMITGDNPKAFGQDIELFGHKKGSGESVWDIKERIGYFTPAMTDRFRGYHSLENMIISGLTDSVGLYTQPTDAQKSLSRKWLALLGLEGRSEALLRDQSAGVQRLVFCARAMVKHPPLLILDEPTAGLDDRAAAMVVSLIRKMAAESRTAIIFVSHRQEPGLMPQKVLELTPGPDGSRGHVFAL